MKFSDETQQTIRKSLWFFLRLAFGAVFIYSGAAKFKDLISFADAVRNFDMVQDPIAPALAILIPSIELIAGIATMLGYFWRGAVLTLFGSLIAFTIALAIAWARGLDISCGCFGGTGAVNYPLVIGRNIVLLVVGVLLLKRATQTI